MNFFFFSSSFFLVIPLFVFFVVFFAVVRPLLFAVHRLLFTLFFVVHRSFTPAIRYLFSLFGYCSSLLPFSLRRFSAVSPSLLVAHSLFLLGHEHVIELLLSMTLFVLPFFSPFWSFSSFTSPLHHCFIPAIITNSPFFRDLEQVIESLFIQR